MRSRVAVCVAALSVAGTWLVPQATATAADPVCRALTVPITSTVNPRSQAQLLTPWASERLSATRYGFTEAAGGLKAAARPAAGLVQVWRAYHPRTHQFTWAQQGPDLANLITTGYVAQKLEFHASATPASCTSPVERFAKGAATRLVIDPAERAGLLATGWTPAGTAFHAAAVPVNVGRPQSSAAPNGTPTPSVPVSTTPVPRPTVSTTPAPPPTTAAPTTAAPTTAAPTAATPTPGTHTSAVPAAPAGTDSTFTIAVMPDTQNEVMSGTDTRFAQRANWLADNAAVLDLAFVTHVGDVVSWDTPDHVQFSRARAGLKRLAATVPLALAAGNHDTGAVCAGGSACPGAATSLTVRDTRSYNEYFDESLSTALAGQFEKGKMENAFHTFAAGGRQWLALTLELWPRKEAVAWARTVVADHPRHNVILTTHSYLTAAGTISTSQGGYGSMAPSYVYDTVVKPFDNVVLVLSGHEGTAASRVDTTAKGAKVVSFLQAFHSNDTNPVRLLEIDVAKGTILTRILTPKDGATLAPYSQSVTGLTFVD